ncbi:MAG: hypothetical protein V7K97_15995 [Nostoc sp.]|uniref:hypothetical protein n=1 Tax=Nostoc sp. TaxID=1180 RepID=UPI002FF801C3
MLLYIVSSSIWIQDKSLKQDYLLTFSIITQPASDPIYGQAMCIIHTVKFSHFVFASLPLLKPVS